MRCNLENLTGGTTWLRWGSGCGASAARAIKYYTNMAVLLNLSYHAWNCVLCSEPASTDWKVIEGTLASNLIGTRMNNVWTYLHHPKQRSVSCQLVPFKLDLDLILSQRLVCRTSACWKCICMHLCQFGLALSCPYISSQDSFLAWLDDKAARPFGHSELWVKRWAATFAWLNMAAWLRILSIGSSHVMFAMYYGLR